MVDTANQISPQDNEPILCVRYTTIRYWVSIVGSLGGLYLFFACAFDLAWEERYLPALFIAGVSVRVLVAVIDGLFTNSILFYRDSISKSWYFFGQRTIPYSRGKIRVLPGHLRSLPGMRSAMRSIDILEVDDTRKKLRFQYPMVYCYACVALESREQVDVVLRYLLGLKEGADIYEAAGVFVKSTLPKDILSGDDLGKPA